MIWTSEPVKYHITSSLTHLTCTIISNNLLTYFNIIPSYYRNRYFRFIDYKLIIPYPKKMKSLIIPDAMINIDNSIQYLTELTYFNCINNSCISNNIIKK